MFPLLHLRYFLCLLSVQVPPEVQSVLGFIGQDAENQQFHYKSRITLLFRCSKELSHDAELRLSCEQSCFPIYQVV